MSYEYFINFQLTASIAFGAEVNSAENVDNVFLKMANESLNFSDLKTQLTLLGYTFIPGIMKFFNVKVFSKKVEQFVLDSVREMMSYREKHQIKRHDLIDTLLKIKKSKDDAIKWDEEDLAAQAFLFYLAGLEAVSESKSKVFIAL